MSKSLNTTAMTRELTRRQLEQRAQNRQVPTDVVDPLIVQQAVKWEERAAKERAEWKRRQALQPSRGALLTPTLPERINRLNPSERHDLGCLIRSLKLRKIIRRTLAEAFWNREAEQVHAAQMSDSATMQRLRAAVRTQKAEQVYTAYDRALTTFEPVITRSHEPTLIEVPR